MSIHRLARSLATDRQIGRHFIKAFKYSFEIVFGLSSFSP